MIKIPDYKIPKSIIFDWDNTLVNSWSMIESALGSTMSEMGQNPWKLEKVKNNVRYSMRDFFPKIFGDNWKKAGEIYRKNYRANHLNKIEFLPDALKLIDKLFKMNILLIIISNKMGDTLRKEVEHLGINDKFFSVIGATDAKYDKPDKDVVDLAFEGSNINPEKDLVWFIGDTQVDIECAYNSKCCPVLYGDQNNINTSLLNKIKNERKESLLHFYNHKEILKYISNWS